ncbi:MAG: IS110 family transposase [Candidatus Methanomethylophilaceae archaeon]|nr:IS110 family transposase [Candidatus Methanomethylophilaceae archaeon]
MFYVGIDYHKDVVAVCVQTGSGRVRAEFETTADHEGMDQIVRSMGGKRFKVMGEASTYSIGLHNYLASRSVDSCLVDPRSLRLITSSDKKTDRHDANVIATFLRLMDRHEIELSLSCVVDDGRRDLRDLCRYREYIGSEKGATLRRMRSHMHLHDQALDGSYGDFSTIKGQTMLRNAFGDDVVLMEMLNDYVYLQAKARRMDCLLGSAEYSSREVDLLTSIPGIGKVTAVQMMSMIVDIDRFESADRMRSYFGMNTIVMDSGGKTCHGRVTKRGDPMMRNILGRVLNVYLVRRPEDTISVYHRAHRDSMGAKKVRMACMNKLLDLVYAILKRGTPYMPRRWHGRNEKGCEGGATGYRRDRSDWKRTRRDGHAPWRKVADCLCTRGAFRKMRRERPWRSVLMSACRSELRRENA